MLISVDDADQLIPVTLPDNEVHTGDEIRRGSMKTTPDTDTSDDRYEWRNRPRHPVRHPCSVVPPWSDQLCRQGGAVERDGRWYCYMQDPERLRDRCSAAKANGDSCGNKATIERDGARYCYAHDPNPDPDKPRRRWEALAEERDRAAWAAATVKAISEGVKVFLIREDMLTVVRALLSQLSYKDVNAVIRAIAALPEAPLVGRERISKKETQ